MVKTKVRHKHLSCPADEKLLSELRLSISALPKPSSTHINLWNFLKLVLYGGLLAIFYVQMLSVSSSGLLAFYYLGFGLSGILLALNFAHDFAHNTIFKQRKLNSIGFWCLFTLVGAHAEAWRKRHTEEHHYAPNVVGYDPDLNITKLIRLQPQAPYFYCHRYQHFYALFAYSTYSLFWIFVKDGLLYAQECRQEGFGLHNLSFHGRFWLQKGLYFFVSLGLPFCYAKSEASSLLIAFVLMHLLQSAFLLLTFLITHHVATTSYYSTDNEGHINCSWLKNQILCSNDFHAESYWANFIFGGFNSHIAHHLFPNVPNYSYPRLSSHIYSFMKIRGIRINQNSYLGSIKAHFKHLKNMGALPLKL